MSGFPAPAAFPKHPHSSLGVEASVPLGRRLGEGSGADGRAVHVPADVAAAGAGAPAG